MGHIVLFLLLVPAFLEGRANADTKCPPSAWLPQGAQPSSCGPLGVAYDGSRVPDCSAFKEHQGNTSIHVAHEYGEAFEFFTSYLAHTSDCGLFWMCVPEGPCLRECPKCHTHPITCPDGTLEFDCRFNCLGNKLK